MKETIGFIGLGGMGLAMATNLVKAGFGLHVYNRTADKARPLLELGAHLARSPEEAVSRGGIVVTMVSNDQAVEEVTLGASGFLDRLGDGIHLSMSTIAPRTASEVDFIPIRSWVYHAPADCPATTIPSGSPPKCWIFRLTQNSAASRSLTGGRSLTDRLGN